MKLIEHSRKAAIWEEEGKRFIVTIGMNKNRPHEDDQIPFRRDDKGLLILKGSSWRYPYTPMNREEMKHWAEMLYHKHA
jgi:predicted type IV restriction endonuclease